MEMCQREGLTPRQSKFETEKKLLRQSIRPVLLKAVSFKDFSARLMQEYGIAVKECREENRPETARKSA